MWVELGLAAVPAVLASELHSDWVLASALSVTEAAEAALQPDWQEVAQ